MSQLEDLEYPQVFRNDEGVEITALNEVQAAAFEKQGFYPSGKAVEKKPRGQQQQ